MTEFTWNKYWEIAEFLEKRFPDTDLVNISRVDILKLIRQIPDFKDTMNPSTDAVNSLIYSWISLRDPNNADTTN